MIEHRFTRPNGSGGRVQGRTREEADARRAMLAVPDDAVWTTTEDDPQPVHNPVDVGGSAP